LNLFPALDNHRDLSRDIRGQKKDLFQRVEYFRIIGKAAQFQLGEYFLAVSNDLERAAAGFDQFDLDSGDFFF
jgi:hypothetical protein